MASVSEWIAGARPRTLPAAIAPVVAGLGVTVHTGTALSTPAVVRNGLLALLVALALQVGVNYFNDYSDGVRGTDEVRVGPVRLVGQGLAAARQVKMAALASLAVAAIAGLALVLLSGQWILLPIGIAAVLSAYAYTGGSRPYGYIGLGEVFVFVFFGPVAVCPEQLWSPGGHLADRGRRVDRHRPAHGRHPLVLTTCATGNSTSSPANTLSRCASATSAPAACSPQPTSSRSSWWRGSGWPRRHGHCSAWPVPCLR